MMMMLSGFVDKSCYHFILKRGFSFASFSSEVISVIGCKVFILVQQPRLFSSAGSAHHYYEKGLK